MTEIFSLFFIKRVDGCTYTGVRSPRSCDGNVKKLK
jgi:hypothetical protein